MKITESQSGYTLPVFACAAAIAGIRCLKARTQPIESVPVDLITPAQTVEIPIEQVAMLKPGVALAMTRSDPGNNLDLTKHTPVWALVELKELPGIVPDAEKIIIQGGEGIGKQRHADGKAAIYAYADQLLRWNLQRELKAHEAIALTIILPEGRQLATRTSNAAFGVVEGLSLLGTSGIAQPLSAPDQLNDFREELEAKAKQFDCLVFCIGENGLDLAQKLGIERDRLLKTANWLGPLLVAAGLQPVSSILLFGYHGKLLKLAGGIFHTHHHLADGRREILAAYGGKLGLAQTEIQAIFNSATAEDALKYLQHLDETTDQNWVNLIYGAIAAAIDQRTQAYIYTHTQQTVCVGSVLFGRNRKIIVTSEIGRSLLTKLC